MVLTGLEISLERTGFVKPPFYLLKPDDRNAKPKDKQRLKLKAQQIHQKVPTLRRQKSYLLNED